MFWSLFEYALLVFIALFFLTQIFIPLMKNKKTFPIFSRDSLLSQKKDLNKLIMDKNQIKENEAALRELKS